MPNHPRIPVLSSIRTVFFVPIVRRVVEIQGSRPKAAAALGISTTTLRRVLAEAYLTERQVKQMVAARKRLKEISDDKP